jgi:DNA-binding HxlR family transcriptional regulator
MVDAGSLREFHRQLRAALDEREAGVAEREAFAQQVLSACAAARQQIVQDRATLEAAESVYARLTGTSPPRLPLSLEEEPSRAAQSRETLNSAIATATAVLSGQKRARIGPQRYLILAALREHDRLPIDLIERSTGLASKRVREQLVADESVGIVSREDSYGRSEYALTTAGHDLLSRYEAYRSSKGLPLPTRESVLQAQGSDGDDGEDEDGDEARGSDAAAPVSAPINPSATWEY